MNKVILLLVITTPFLALAQQQAPQGPAVANFSIKKLAFEVNRVGSSRTDIYVIDSPGAKSRHLVEGVNPAWSPDGTKVAYCVREGTGFGQIQVVDADGSGHAELTKLKGGACVPDWSPDGQKIIFTGAYTAKTASIFVMSSNGENVTQITAGYGARWSRDGRQVVFCRPAEGKGTTGSIWVANPDGTEAKKVVEDNSPVLEPAWSPDGKSIVFSSGREHRHRSGLFRVNLDGSALEAIADDTGSSLYFPVPSPDGRRMVADAYSSKSAEMNVVLLDLASQQGRVLARGSHPSVLWEKP